VGSLNLILCLYKIVIKFYNDWINIEKCVDLENHWGLERSEWLNGFSLRYRGSQGY